MAQVTGKNASGTAIKFSNPNYGRLVHHIESTAARNLPMVERGSCEDAPGAVVCALGGSIQEPDVIDAIRAKADAGWHVFALKEAVDHLLDLGIPVHYSANMDPGPQEAGRIQVREGVTYFLASSCHPIVFDSVLDRGGKIVVYHSACGVTSQEIKRGFVLDMGIPELGMPDQAIAVGVFEMETVGGCKFAPCFPVQTDEVDVYWSLFGAGDTVIGGFTVANRALGLAKYMGFKNVLMAGADFGWRGDGSTHEKYYAGFVEAKPLQDVWMTDHGDVDGESWSTRPDLLASAVDIARHIKRGDVEVIGDSLAISLSKRDDEYLNKVCRLEDGV